MPETTPEQVMEAAAEAMKASAGATPKKRKTVTKKTLQECLSETMAEVGYVQKDAKNSFHKYSYASAEAVLKKVNASLSKHGICLRTQYELLRYQEPTTVVRATVTFVKGSEEISVQGLGEGSDKGDKSIMKAETAAMKYAYSGAFAISWGDDPEADEETDRRAAQAAPKTNGKPKRASARAKGTAPVAVAATEPSVEGLMNRIEAHSSEASLAEDRQLVEDLKAVTDGNDRTRLRRVWLQHEKTLREAAE